MIEYASKAGRSSVREAIELDPSLQLPSGKLDDRKASASNSSLTISATIWEQVSGTVVTLARLAAGQIPTMIIKTSNYMNIELLIVDGDFL